MSLHDEILAELKARKYRASINQDYHECFVWGYGWADRGLKIVLGLVACVSFMLSAYDYGAKHAGNTIQTPDVAKSADSVAWWGVAFGLFSLVVAVGLNISPLDRNEQHHAKILARWNELYKDVSNAMLRLKFADESALAAIKDRLPDFLERQSNIEMDEPPIWRWVMDYAQCNENERNFGVRGDKEAEAVRASRAA
ncbi:hypothetical protein NA78x_001736 [Anatilimnocola sp. NA78]|uniref:hypothetical protein n=1 Tax=Anatilimnocola sp. NA78 TaxID=3415683 RepID=UPI003CE45A49